MLAVHSKPWFWGLGIALGVFVGPAQASSRSLMARMAPKGKETEMFGLYALSGTITAFMGPALYGFASGRFASQRAGMAVVVLFLAIGLLLLLRVKAARPQWRKWRIPVKTMARPASSAAAITSSSRIEPPGWMTAVAPAAAAARSPSAKGKKASEATTEPLVREAFSRAALPASSRLPGGDARGIDAAHLAGADADRGAVLGIDDGVRLDVLGDGEGEQQVVDLALARRAPGHDLELPAPHAAVVAASATR